MPPDEHPEQRPLDVAYSEPPPPEEVAIALDERAEKRLRKAKKISERREYEKHGVEVLKLKLKTYRMLKNEIDSIGIKTIGHCSIMIAREKAESIVAELDGIAKEMDESDEMINPEVKVALRQLKLDCIKVMLDSGVEQLKAERQPSDQQSGGRIQLPFPVGAPIALAIGSGQDIKPDRIEGPV